MILPLLIGLSAGILAGLFGVGGGVVIVPALVLGLKFTVRQAIGTSLAALLLPVGVFGVWEYYRRGFVVVSAAVWIAAGLVLGAWLGSRLGLSASSRTMQQLFALFLLGIAIHLWRTA